MRNKLKSTTHLVQSDVEKWRVEYDQLKFTVQNSWVFAFLWLLEVEVTIARQVLEASINVAHRNSIPKLFLKGFAQTWGTYK